MGLCLPFLVMNLRIYDALKATEKHYSETTSKLEKSQNKLITSKLGRPQNKLQTQDVHKVSVSGKGIHRRNEIAENNLLYFTENKYKQTQSGQKEGKQYSPDAGTYIPGQKVGGFQVPTLAGPLTYPGPVINETTPVLINSFKPYSGFQDCLWSSNQSVADLLQNSPKNAHYIFMSDSDFPYSDVFLLRERFLNIAADLIIRYTYVCTLIICIGLNLFSLEKL